MLALWLALMSPPSEKTNAAEMMDALKASIEREERAAAENPEFLKIEAERIQKYKENASQIRVLRLSSPKSHKDEPLGFVHRDPKDEINALTIANADIDEIMVKNRKRSEFPMRAIAHGSFEDSQHIMVSFNSFERLYSNCGLSVDRNDPVVAIVKEASILKMGEDERASFAFICRVYWQGYVAGIKRTLSNIER